jgi:hypothetical protein
LSGKLRTHPTSTLTANNNGWLVVGWWVEIAKEYNLRCKFMNPFELLVANLNSLGFFGFLLPWLFVFVVVFAILLKTKVLGENTKIMGVLSLVIAFFVIGYGGPAMASFFVNLFGLAALVLAGILVVILFVAMAGGDISKLASNKAVLAIIAGIGIVVFFIAIGAIGVQVSESVLGIIFIIIVMAVAIVFVTKS